MGVMFHLGDVGGVNGPGGEKTTWGRLVMRGSVDEIGQKGNMKSPRVTCIGNLVPCTSRKGLTLDSKWHSVPCVIWSWDTEDMVVLTALGAYSWLWLTATCVGGPLEEWVEIRVYVVPHAVTMSEPPMPSRRK